MTGYPFTGKILVEDDEADEKTVSAFNKTEWDNDKPTVKGQTAHAFKLTDWDTDADDAETQVTGLTYTTDEWQ